MAGETCGYHTQLLTLANVLHSGPQGQVEEELTNKALRGTTAGMKLEL